MSRLFLALLGVALAFAVPQRSEAETTLNVSTYAPYTHPLVSVGLMNWAKDVESASDGSLNINILQTPLGQPQAHYDMAVNGIADITLGIPGYTPGRFNLIEVSGVPNTGNSATGLSVALWRTFEKYPEFQKEFSDVKVLGVFTTSPMHFYNTERPIESASDFAGLKTRVAGGLMADIGASLGITPILQPAGKVYELMSGGIIDAVIFPRETIKSFKLEKLIKHATIVPGGLTAVPIFLVMNKAKFEGLSAADKAALDKASGEHLSRVTGIVWDERDREGIELLKKEGGQVQTASPELTKEIFGKTGPVVEKWVADVSSKTGVDGQEMLEFFRAEVKKVESE